MFYVVIIFGVLTFFQNVYASEETQEVNLNNVIYHRLWDDDSMREVKKLLVHETTTEPIDVKFINDFFKSKKFTGLEVLDLHGLPITDEYIKGWCDSLEGNMCYSFSKLEFIDLSGTPISLESLRILLASKVIGMVRVACDSHPNYNKPLSTLEVKIDGTPAILEFREKLKSTPFPLPLHFDFRIELVRSEETEQRPIPDGIKQLKILADDKKYEKPPSPRLNSDIVASLTDSLSRISIEDLSISKDDLKLLLKKIEEDINKGKFTKKEITRVVGYSGDNAARDFGMMQSLRSRIPLETQWKRINKFLIEKGSSIGKPSQSMKYIQGQETACASDTQAHASNEASSSNPSHYLSSANAAGAAAPTSTIPPGVSSLEPRFFPCATDLK